MLFRLVIAFTIIPILELALLIKVGTYIGTINTLLIIFTTGITGAILAKAEGLGVLQKIHYSLRSGVLPTEELLDGAFILVGGALLLTPGLITDGFGFICLIPLTRNLIKIWLKNKMKDMIDKGQINFYRH